MTAATSPLVAGVAGGFPVASEVCSWSSPREGFRHEIEFGPTGVFTVTSLPLTRPVGGVVICSSLLEELQRGYRAEVLLARKLARHGFVTARFHYRGTGNSLGDDDQITFGDLTEDARGVLGGLRTRVPGLPIGFVGARLGALVSAATATASRQRHPALAFWDPVPDLATYLAELRRAAVAMTVVRDRRTHPLCGADLPGSLVATAEAHTLGSLGGSDLGPVFVGQLADRGPRAAATRATELLRTLASSVDVSDFPEEKLAWLVPCRRDVPNSTAPWPLLDRTVEWLSQVLAPTAA